MDIPNRHFQNVFEEIASARRWCWSRVLNLVREGKQEQRTVITQSKAAELLANLWVHDVGQFISWAIAGNLKGGGFIAQVRLVILIRAEDQMADSRVKAVGADNDVECTRWRTLERDSYGIRRLFDLADAVVEDGFDAVPHFAINDVGQVGSGNADVTAMSGAGKGADGKTCDPPPASVHDTSLVGQISTRRISGIKPMRSATS